MQNVKVDIQTHRGSHYDLGVETAKWMEQTRMLRNREKEWKKRNPRFDIDINETFDIYQHFAPQIWEEIMALRDVLNIPTKQAILNFAHYRFTDLKDSGCTVYVGDDYLVRNYDYHPATYDGRYLLFQPNDGGYAQIGPISRITGRMDGMNEHGLVMAYNFMHRKKPQNGFVCYMIGRLILELCKDVNEVIAFLKTLPHRSSFSYIVQDKQLNHAIVEVTPRGVEVRNHQTCTNHFEILTHENRNYTKESKERLAQLHEHLKEPHQQFNVYRMFNDPKYNLYSKLFKSWSGTIHTSMYEPTRLKAWFGLGENSTPTSIDFKSWLNGHPLTIDHFEGVIETDITFASH
ncbi:C45 family autoproteolytic acyltransferase/hydolase [Staphylococcus massiliensis]|uniref:Peptidase C45 hydrolase domain-containing protein n=1 Tax=Staphylococcus massiliensis S46 TaxID=1229783 RepID=K9ASI6_9STAP|nr:C45 family autoproteolytic acyltransferase/hydolase [Staphylococcus massiliensis]EKU45607.1 hypothetical protein C273_11036 [Staphylococcus massiliensis S46]MCG3402630.1 acyl-CoA--6-aminopenicillanic acid acyltransferase [Staphylococcus massiliensis]MCG3413098.1 acyl-CoA--6-aminopenicillanic acid acyltransferase [Staphylococcus massiliensis]PNZ97940.1 acyl-CoA--6-aminopenicillanic acid acyltransferase [Staphylococcus massiliensis CCUG 55927]